MNANSENKNFIELKSFLSTFLGIKEEEINFADSLFHDLGVDGDDASELLKNYSSNFNVDIDDFEFENYFGVEASASLVQVIFKGLIKSDEHDRKKLTVEDLANGVKLGRLESWIFNLDFIALHTS